METEDPFAYVFTKPGTYEYFCAVHPHMTGRIIVK
jgi:plastocyanin